MSTALQMADAAFEKILESAVKQDSDIDDAECRRIWHEKPEADRIALAIEGAKGYLGQPT